MSGRVGRLAFGLLIAGGLAACSSTGEGGSGNVFTNLIFLNDPSPPPAQVAAARTQLACPRVELLGGTAALMIYERGGEGDARQVRYQASISQTARECADLGAEVGIRVGVQGRVLAGPVGGPGTLDVPIRIAMLDPEGQPVSSNLARTSVTIPQGQTGVSFSYVDESITFPIPEGGLGAYRIVVGFDQGGGAGGGRGGRR